MIEGFIRPHRTASVCILVDGMGRGALDCLSYVLKADHLRSLVIHQRPENEMNVIRHHYRCIQVVSSGVIMKAALQDDVSRPIRENATVVS